MTGRRAAAGLDEVGIPGPRDFTYITPKRRRVSEYEAVTLFVQPLEADSPTPRAMRSTWPEEATRLRSGDWFAFRDPAEMWSRTYMARQAEQERALERVSRLAREGGLYDRIDPAWASLLGDVYVTAAYFERGLFQAMNFAQMHAPSDVLAVASAFHSVDKQRHAEDILFYHYDLLDAGVPAGTDSRRTTWLDDPLFQPTRELVERVIATADWGEIMMAVNLVIEPLLGRFLFNEVLLRNAAVHGDLTTPPILLEAESDRQRNLDWTVELVRLLLDDDEHGAANRTVLGEWLEAWTTRVDAVVASLRPVSERAGADHDQAVAAAARSQVAHLERCGLTPAAIASGAQ